MITTEAIIDAANMELLKIFPSCTFYTDFTEKDFARPAFLILCEKRGAAKKLTRRVSEFVLYMTVWHYAKTNEYYRADGTGLRDVLDKMTDIFAKEFMHVGERAVRVKVADGGVREKEAYLDLEIRYTEESGVPDADEKEIMRKLYQKMN